MRWIVLILLTLSGMNFNQKDPIDYEIEWKEVDNLIAERKYRSALEKSRIIYKYATEENNHPQMIKSIYHVAKLISNLSDHESAESIEFLIEESSKWELPISNLVHFLTAQHIRNYYHNVFYKISDRTYTESVSSMGEWAPRHYEQAILHHLEQALVGFEQLFTSMDEYKPILNDYDSLGLNLRPSIADFLSHQIIEQLSQTLMGISDFSPPLSMEEWHGDYLSFIQIPIEEVENDNRQRILSIYQSLIKHHHSQGNISAMFHADLTRLEYVYQESGVKDKNERFLSVLNSYIEKENSAALKNQFFFYKANFLKRRADEETGERNIALLKEALVVCEQASGDDYFSARLMALSQDIRRPEFTVKSKEVYSTREHYRFTVQSKNINKLHYRLIAIPFRDANMNMWQFNEENQKIWLTLTPREKGTLTLDVKEFIASEQNVFTGSKLPLGRYLLLFSEDEDFQKLESGFYVLPFQVSDISAVKIPMTDEPIWIVTDRTSGRPLRNAQMDFFTFRYNSQSRRNERIFAGTRTSDQDGKVVWVRDMNTRSFQYRIRLANDTLDTDASAYLYSTHNEQYIHQRENFYVLSDRAIYRPGQTIYFKILHLFENEKGMPSILTNKELRVRLWDVNRRLVAENNLKTNAFGSVSSAFTLPTTGLAGSYSIEVSTDHGHMLYYFRVEEYKRPSFFVEFGKPDALLKLDSLVTIHGKAESYNRIPVAHAQVSYKVTRRFPYVYRYSRGIFPPFRGEETIIAEGITATDQNGRFHIAFHAESSLSDFWEFTTVADVTEATGESRSASYSITLSKKAVIIGSGSKKETDVAGNPQLKYNLYHPSGYDLDLPSSYTVIQMSPKGEFQFHEYVVGDESALWENWRENRVVRRGDIPEGESKTVSLKGLAAGFYKWIVTVGNEKYEDYIILTDFRKGSFPELKDMFYTGVSESYAPGETVRLQLGTPHKNLYVYVETIRNYKVEKSGWIRIKSKSTYSVPVSTSDYGGFSIRISGNINNRFISEIINVQVPWTHKELDIKLKTFRDQVTPGQEEEWRLEVKGSTAGSVEVAMTMYDQSLDFFTPHKWSRTFYPGLGHVWSSEGIGYSLQFGRHLRHEWNHFKDRTSPSQLRYPLFNFSFFIYDLYPSAMMKRSVMSDVSEMGMEIEVTQMLPNTASPEADPVKEGKDPFSIRKNLRETVFFYPQMVTDETGRLQFSFTMGEALTKWKLLIFAHNKELQTAFGSWELVTSKQLMIQPLLPRFFRQGDQMRITARVSNESDQQLNVKASLFLKNGRTGEDITEWLKDSNHTVQVSLQSNGQNTVEWNIAIPENMTDPVVYRIVADSDLHSDGEEGIIPVISNREWVTESRAFSLHANQSITLDMDQFLKRSHQPSLTFEYVPHPVWMAIQSAPILEGRSNESADRLALLYSMGVFYKKLMEAHPVIEETIRLWEIEGDSALESPLLKNQEVKSIIIEHTPWFNEAMDESERMRSIIQWLDKNTMNHTRQNALRKLMELQNDDGGLSWFSGGRSNDYISIKVLEMMIVWEYEESGLVEEDKNKFLTRLIEFADNRSLERYQRILKRKKGSPELKEKELIEPMDIYYLFVRHQWKNDFLEGTQQAYHYFLKNALQSWKDRNDFEMAMIARIAFRSGNPELAGHILSSFEERLISDKKGLVYWKTQSGWQWYQRPMETHIYILDLFLHIKPESHLIHGMKLWLLEHKRTQRWQSTEVTARAIWNLTSTGGSAGWVSDRNEPIINVNESDLIDMGAPLTGTGSVKKFWSPNEVKDIRTISVENNNDNMSWGGVYQTYMVELHEIEPSGDKMISVTKQMFKKVREEGVDKLIPVEYASIQPGDRIISRMSITVDRDMEFLHLRDMRTSGLEPGEQVSGYRWNSGLSFYQTTGDVSTDFYIERISKGTYVLEHMLWAVHQGTFKNGIA
ncbi:MAG TPA: alpha-2-macroglobulin family protein, partial [Saprospiraceae bacterium]|nr:alpha-2-macroglobulin family protein [Saprospiraceae bacterium]